MRHKEWIKQLTDLHTRSKKLIVDESVLVTKVQREPNNPNADVTVLLAEDGIRFLNIVGNVISEGTVQDYYAAGNNAWGAALGDLRAKIEMAESISEKMVHAAVAPYMKEAVLDRLVGADDIPSNETILKIAAKKREIILHQILPDPFLFPKDFRLDCPLPSPSKFYNLQVEYWLYNRYVIYGDKNNRDEATIKQNLSFLDNFEEIKRTITRLAKIMDPLTKLKY